MQTVEVVHRRNAGGLGLGIVEASIILEEINRSGANSGACHAQMYVMGTLLRHGDLEAANSLLKPGGHILLGTPYHGYLKNLALAVTGRMDSHFSALHDGGHIKFFSVKTLSQLLITHSFENLSFTFYGRAPWLWKNMICHARMKTHC